MLTWTDRLYGELALPPSVRYLASSCPLILRLREIRMPNVPFLTFPSFAGVTRYEHSLGVAHLAWWWARHNGLDSDDAEALSLAALYHDAATPAFSHLFEEFLRPTGFDHEAELRRLISAQSGIPGAFHAQVFLGLPAKLPHYLQDRAKPGARLSASGIVRMFSGSDPLGTAIQGDIDLDNIDNVIRAATAMGLIASDMVHPFEVARALVWDGEAVKLASGFGHAIAKWREARRLLYEAILGSKHEFITQTALKWALDEYSIYDPHFIHDSATWTLTEPELVYGRLRQHARSRHLVDLVRLGRGPELLASAVVKDISPFLRPGAGANSLSDLNRALSQLTGLAVYVNYYVDKRERGIQLPPSDELVLFPHEPEEEGKSTGGLVGIVGIHPASLGESGAASPTGPLDLDAIAGLLERALGAPAMDLQRGWVGTRRHHPLTTALL